MCLLGVMLDLKSSGRSFGGAGKSERLDMRDTVEVVI